MRTLSVIVPVYNVEKYIHQCIDSLLAQGYQDMEILLIDDGSPDNCPQICDAYAQKDLRIRVIHQENKGIAETRNIGIREANGEYITFADPDDFVLPDMVSTMMACFEMDTNTDIVVCDNYIFNNDADDQLILQHQDIHPDWSTEKIRDEFLMDHYPTYLCNKIYRKELFRGVTIPKGMLCEDLFVMAPVIARARKIVYLPKAFYCYRQHDSTYKMSSKIQKKWGTYLAWRERERVCEEYNCTDPLKHCRMRAQKAAISTRIIDLGIHYLSDKQINDLDAYLKQIERDTSLLPVKHKLELWALHYLPELICSLLGKLSIYWEAQKQSKWRK